MNVDQDDPIVRAIQQLVETRDTEFKESQPYENLRWKLMKSCMAMANLRDGGLIVLGVSERNGRPEATGIQPLHEATYNQDDLIALVNRHAKPPVSLRLRFVAHNDIRFIGLEVEAASPGPIICFRDTPPEAGDARMYEGNIPVRSLDRIATTRLVNAELMAELVEIAAEKRAAQIIATAQRIGLRMPDAAADQFRREREDFGDFE